MSDPNASVDYIQDYQADTSDYDYEQSTGHTPCGDDDN